MRIAFLCWRDTTHPEGGGSEVYVESVGRELARRGHEVHLVCARHPGSSRRERRDGIEIHRRGGRLGVYPTALLWLLYRRRHIDVVVDVVNGLPFAVPLVRRRGVVALVHHLHREQWQIIYPGLPGRLGWFLEGTLTPRLYRQVRFLTVSEATRSDLLTLGVGPERITIARNAVPAASLGEARPESPTPRLSTLSRLVPHKRIEQAFAVVARLAEEFPDVGLDVIGEGWWRAELEQAAVDAGVTQRVCFHGRVEESQRDRLLSESWLMLVPSVKEGWCLAVTEAGAQGTPSIGYATAGGVQESIEHQVTGILVDDEQELYVETALLLRDHRRRQALGAAAHVKASRLTWTSTCDVVEALLEEVSRPASPRW